MFNSKKLVLSMKGINKSYPMGEEELQVLFDVDFEVYAREFVAVLGPSGSGKSTLMNIIGCLDVASSGTYILNGQDISTLKDKELAAVRNHEIGFVFQNFQLLSRMSALDNVILPLIYARVPSKERKQKAMMLLNKVGLGDKMLNKPKQLSGGQQQRVAIARAMITEPSIILADEPTGALDQATGAQIMELFKSLNKDGKTIIMITHDPKIARQAERIVHILDGKIYSQEEYDALYNEEGVKKGEETETLNIRERRRRRLMNV